MTGAGTLSSDILASMDDLLDLDWDKKPTAGTSIPKANNGSYNSSYNFDALTRSLPQQQQYASNNVNLANKVSTNSKQQSVNAKQSNADAFSSLLGFDSSSSSRSGSATNISMAERLKKDQQQKLGISAGSGRNTPALSASPAESAWEGLDTFLASSKKSQPVSSVSK